MLQAICLQLCVLGEDTLRQYLSFAPKFVIKMRCGSVAVKNFLKMKTQAVKITKNVSDCDNQDV